MVNPDKIFGRLGNRMFQMAFILARMWDGEIDDYYLQDPKYFDQHRLKLRGMFGQGIEPINQVSIHVRRGANPSNPDEPNYSENPFYVNLYNTDYYERAMEQFPDAEFLVFSDDVEWCKTQPLFKDCEFAGGNTEIEDFNLMAGCKGHIIANSSFSWWAAYLSGNKTVAPSEWFTDGVERVGFPPEWIRI